MPFEEKGLAGKQARSNWQRSFGVTQEKFSLRERYWLVSDRNRMDSCSPSIKTFASLAWHGQNFQQLGGKPDFWSPSRWDHLSGPLSHMRRPCLEPRLHVPWRSRESIMVVWICFHHTFFFPFPLLFRDEKDPGEIQRDWTVDREVGADQLFRRACTTLCPGFRLGWLLFHLCQHHIWCTEMKMLPRQHP